MRFGVIVPLNEKEWCDGLATFARREAALLLFVYLAEKVASIATLFAYSRSQLR
jgi:hypothetical protein